MIFIKLLTIFGLETTIYAVNNNDVNLCEYSHQWVFDFILGKWLT